MCEKKFHFVAKMTQVYFLLEAQRVVDSEIKTKTTNTFKPCLRVRMPGN